MNVNILFNFVFCASIVLLISGVFILGISINTVIKNQKEAKERQKKVEEEYDLIQERINSLMLNNRMNLSREMLQRYIDINNEITFSRFLESQKKLQQYKLKPVYHRNKKLQEHIFEVVQEKYNRLMIYLRKGKKDYANGNVPNINPTLTECDSNIEKK